MQVVAFLRRSYSVSEKEDQRPFMHGYTTNVRDGDGPTIETPLQQPPLDAGEASGCQRRALRSGSLRLPCLCFIFTVYTSSPTWCSVNVKISAHANISLWRKLFGTSRSFCLSHYRSGSTGSDIFWGVPQPIESLAGYSRHTSSISVCDHAYLLLDEFSPLVGVDAVHSLRVAPHQPDLPSSQPQDLSVLSSKLCPHRVKETFSYLSSSRLILPAVGRRPEPTIPHSPSLSWSLTGRRTSSARLSSSRRGYVSNLLGMGLHLLKLGLGSPIVFNYQWPRPLLSQPTMLWGYLVSLINCLKVIYEFTGVGTEAGLHITMHLSCTKSLLSSPLPVGLPGSSSSPLASFSLEKRTTISTTSLLRSVIPSKR
ncbi:hypothetical protein YC2023_034546 [Brassica napus]